MADKFNVTSGAEHSIGRFPQQAAQSTLRGHGQGKANAPASVQDAVIEDDEESFIDYEDPSEQLPADFVMPTDQAPDNPFRKLVAVFRESRGAQ
ncbi:hypothetical protein KIPB_011978, partial [Kipferlia bialata]|eukprot:g11978.t1